MHHLDSDHRPTAGRRVENVVSFPRAALRESGELIVVDRDDRLRFREVGLLRVERERILVESGVEAGDRVCVSPIDEPVEGMRVRVADER